MEDYLHCFIADQTHHWLRLLLLAEWHYNTLWHSAIRMSPYEAVFGWTFPSLLDYISGSKHVRVVDDLLKKFSQVLFTLRSNLLHVPNKMSNQTNAHHSDTIFGIGDWEFLRLQLYH